MLDINQLPNISELADIETNFRVFAGPGAGKTTWLMKHLEKVLKDSKRLNKTRKIACITYTNVAVEEIVNKLECDKIRLDISTIHSFLYRNIVKPFSYLIAKDTSGEALFNVEMLDGHDDHIPRRDMLGSWVKIISEGKKKYWYLTKEENFKDVFACLQDIDWKIEEGDLPVLKFRNKWTHGIAKKCKFPSSKLLEYKKVNWKKGIMHHEDVLYFSYMIVKNHPRILEFVRNKFPYIFIDEFQDTTELQTFIIQKLAESEIKVGVIGDLSQSIYKFAGAKRTDFECLELNDMQSYKLEKNRRSTQHIIDFLNCLRTDIVQEPTEDTSDGEPVKLLVGPFSDALNWLEENGPKETFTLARKNITVEEIHNQTTKTSDDFLKKLYAEDSNSSRVRVMHSILKGFKFQQKIYLKDAVKQVIKPIKKQTGRLFPKLELRRIAIKILDDLKSEETQKKSLFDYYMGLHRYLYNNYDIKIGAKIAGSGGAKDFYSSLSISDLLRHIKVDTKSEDTVRTIHSAKGTQFESVLVCFDEVKDFERYVFDAPNHLNAEEDDARIYYVGFSRAEKSLFICVPAIAENNISDLQDLNIEHEILN